jgi:hypothetical protein
MLLRVDVGLRRLDKLEINSGDRMFAELRDKNFAMVGKFINVKAKSLSTECVPVQSLENLCC